MQLSNQYINQVSLKHRKDFGQFYTPEKIAKFMLNWLIEKNPKEIYDPAFGMGAFYFSAKKLGYSGNFIGGEIDNVSFNFFETNFNNLDTLTLKNEDYFSNWSNKWDSIICNPPYLKFQKYENKKEIFEQLGKLLGTKVSGYTNIASAFLLKSIYELSPNGRLAYIMPLEFLNTGYGKVVKEVLLTHGSIVNIIHITDEENVFSSVTTTICIIFFEKNKNLDHVNFSKIENVSTMHLNTINKIKTKDISAKVKWLNLFDEIDNTSPNLSNENLINIRYYGHFVRGIATGANEFFILDKNKVEQLKLNSNEVSVCITKSSLINSPIFSENDLNNLIENNYPIYIFNPKDNLSDAAKNYINSGETQKYNERYLTKNRKNWYILENRNSFPILFGVFSRDGFKIIRNLTNILSLTCYHGFKPTTNGLKYIDKIFIFLKSNIAKKMLFKNKRVYGKTLDKFEPSDLNNILIPKPEILDKIPDEIISFQLKNIQQNDNVTVDFDNYLEDIIF